MLIRIPKIFNLWVKRAENLLMPRHNIGLGVQLFEGHLTPQENIEIFPWLIKSLLLTSCDF